MDAIKYLKEAERMCSSFEDCTSCPLRTKTYYCALHDIESVPIVEKWSKEHPQKTRLTDFKEKYPDGKLNEHDVPYVCANYLGYCNKCPGCGCTECWNTPID